MDDQSPPVAFLACTQGFLRGKRLAVLEPVAGLLDESGVALEAGLVACVDAMDRPQLWETVPTKA